MFSQARAAVSSPGCCAIHPSQGDTEFFAMYCDDSVLRSLTNKATMCECLGVRSRVETVVGANSGATGAHPRTCRGALWVFSVPQECILQRIAEQILIVLAPRVVEYLLDQIIAHECISERNVGAPRSRWSTFPCPLSSKSRSCKLSR